MKHPFRILAATDLSAPARHAVERAFHLSANVNGELYILHAIELDALDGLREMLEPVHDLLSKSARKAR